MSRTFQSFAAFGQFVGAAADKMPTEKASALQDIGTVVTELAQSKPGTYQDAIAGYNAWPELAPSTKIERRLLGFTENQPLLRTGELKDSYTHVEDAASTHVGSPLAKAAVLEGGDGLVPPRQVAGPAMAEELNNAAHRLKLVAVIALGG